MAGGPARGGFAFPKEARILRRRDFLRIQRRGKRRRSSHFVVLTRPGPSPVTRGGFTVSREVGNAVCRNYVKRRLREFFRIHRRGLPGRTDYVFIARRGAAELSYAEIERELRTATGLG